MLTCFEGLEVPWREKISPLPMERPAKVPMRPGTPSRYLCGCCRPFQHPAVPTLRRGKEGQARESTPSTQTQSPPLLGKRRGAEKGAPAPQLLQREMSERYCGGGAPWGLCSGSQLPAPRLPWVSGLQVQDGEEKKKKEKKSNRNKPNPRGMQCDNPKLEGPPGRRVEELGLQRGQQLSGHSSLHVTLQF